MSTKKRQIGHIHTQKDKTNTHRKTNKKDKECLWNSTALNWGISYNADKVENSTVFNVKAVIRK